MNEEVMAKIAEAQAAIQAAMDALQGTGEAEAVPAGPATQGRGGMAGALGIGGE